MIIDCISDLHGHYPQLDGGDLLIIAGDLTAKHTIKEFVVFLDWLGKQKYRKKILIGGNHDTFLDEGLPLDVCDKLDQTCDYLLDSDTEFEGMKIWGTPWSKTFLGMNPKCKAFTRDTEEGLQSKFSLIPDDIDILISHSPFLYVLDQNIEGQYCGSYTLREAVDRIQPKLFVCGHIHEQGGQMLLYKQIGKNSICINASHVNEHYEPVNKPMRLIL